ncbi:MULTISPECIES: amidase [Amycolatopsis]|uniref:Amidase n=1 Tax=Amycolatopsis dendrobii TaxID=2760662 RepID=A0A7W3ZDA1_9PSEU|nr:MULTISPECIES: amidase [Amycolatopsis]MBB1157200.1 amidase [Amycolatopsis dendrobii]UKD59412.1 amidase [Amycolatopsis sp. FU40]
MTDLTLAELAAAVRARDVSPVELAEEYLGRIDRDNEKVGAYLAVDREGALAAAREAEALVLSGTRDLPALCGVPVSVKDTWPVKGLRYTAGSKVFADRVAEVDAAVVTQLRQAGMVVLGKTNAAEFGCSSCTETVFGAARNPHDLARTAGGSSGGAAASVAAGLAPAAHGSDGGGSVRIPAACCGLVGIKPTRGRVSPAPGPDSAGLATAGPIARTVADAALLLDAMSAARPGDTHQLPPVPDGHFANSAERDPGRLRIGVLRGPASDDPWCRRACEDTAALLADLGHDVADAAPTGPDDYREEFAVVWSLLAASVPVPAEREQDLLPLTRWLREKARGYDAVTFMSALVSMQAAARRIATRYDRFDVVLSSATAALPPLVGGLADADPERTFENMLEFHPLTPLANITGQPSLTVPALRTPGGLPAGVLLTGRYGAETTLISVAAQLERAQR